MAQPSLLPDFFHRIARYDAECIVYDDAYRGRTWTYEDLARMTAAFAVRLHEAGIGKGSAVMIWSESRPGWMAALWACLLNGIVLVPVDPLSSVSLFHRIERKVSPGAILLGGRVGPVVSENAGTPVWMLDDLEAGIDAPVAPAAGAPLAAPEPIAADDIAEIVFTSGTTAAPKGVLITHGNLGANLRDIEEQIAPYTKYVRPFLPLRILNLLPLSHLFGQAMAAYIPPMIPASVVFISGAGAHEIARQIRARRVTILVSVPKVLEMLRSFVLYRLPEAEQASTAHDSLVQLSWWRRTWRFRRIHRLFGWKFLCFVVGGAPLPPDVEEFWTALGFFVVQGYGLTETAPVISFNHPFHLRRGTTGKPLAGVEVKIAEDGEILVRGGNVTQGYFEAPEETAAAFREGWFHTGDIGEIDAEGHLVVRGRKKEIIVTPEGLKVFPEDVEAVLRRILGVEDAAVIGENRVHAVLVVAAGADPDAIVRQANQQLEEHQKIRSVSTWTGRLPRTATTGKLRRAQIAMSLKERALEERAAVPVPGRGGVAGLEAVGGLADVVQRYAPGRTITDETTLDELGLSSLDRVELMMELEEKLHTSIEESAFASVRTMAELARVAQPAGERAAEGEPASAMFPLSGRDRFRGAAEVAGETPFPAYNRTWPARQLRRAALAAVLLPGTRLFAHLHVSGLEHLAGLKGPVVFAANHQSHLDTPAVLAALPRRWRWRIAPAMWKEYFDAHFAPERHSFGERCTKSLTYALVTLLFNAYPVPQSGFGAREAIRYTGELVEEGWSILIFPEGERSVTGEIGRFQPGVGMIASRLGVPVVPVRLKGLTKVLPPPARWPRPGRVEVIFGRPLTLRGNDYDELAGRVESAVKAL